MAVRVPLAGIAAVAVWMSCSVAVAEPNPASPWVALEPQDIARLGSMGLRDKETLHLRAQGDFNGDGRADSAEIRKHPTEDRYGVIACFADGAGGCSEQLVSAGPRKDLANLGISSTRATEAECRLMAGGSSSTADCLDIFTFESGAARYRWNGARFAEKWIAD